MTKYKMFNKQEVNIVSYILETTMSVLGLFRQLN